MITGIDHVVILADDLDGAIRQYQHVGFKVTPGGKHPRFTHNALVPFADGTYLELIAFYELPEAGSDETHRWHRHLATGGGLVDYAVGATDVEEVKQSASERGVALAGPVAGARTRPDGVAIRWRSVMPEGANVGAAPFVIEDETDRGLRVPSDRARHANHATGVEAVVIAVRDLDAAVTRHAALLGRDNVSGDGEVERDGARGVFFMVGPHRVELVTPTGDVPMQELLDRRGDSVFELVLRSDQHGDLQPGEAANARIRFVPA